MSEKKETQIEGFENVQNALGKSEAFVEHNQKPLMIGVGAIVLLVCAVLCYKTYYVAPREQAAESVIYKAEQYFARDSFRLALNGDDNVMGFLDIIDEYGSTKSGKLAKVYAGLCYKNMGEYENAIKYLKTLDADDELLTPAVKGSIGDCYFELGENGKAIDFYKKAAAVDNEMISPIYLQRAGVVYLSEGKNAEALALFNELKEKYPNTMLGNGVDKYIELASK
ncbi:MAG: tetratricopeptide repeat protein [Paludibacteraceae bacterium]|nr:tetratricopeptide repeat protein [Prevotellaceae bacterium]